MFRIEEHCLPHGEDLSGGPNGLIPLLIGGRQDRLTALRIVLTQFETLPAPSAQWALGSIDFVSRRAGRAPRDAVHETLTYEMGKTTKRECSCRMHVWSALPNRADRAQTRADG